VVKEFIIVCQIDLRPGYQRIQAFEVDDDNLIQHGLSPIARFAGSWCEPIWVLSRESYELLWGNLALDADSSALDHELREEIAAAMESPTRSPS